MSKSAISEDPVKMRENESDDVTKEDSTAIAAIAALEAEAAIPKGTLDPVYEAKARVLNAAVSFTMFLCVVRLREGLTFHQIQDIGMGWYQWQLFIVVGFGWANDSKNDQLSTHSKIINAN